MKIGILTFSCADNVGAVLQCFALQHYLEDCNYEVDIINYVPYYLSDSYGTIHNPIDFAKRNGIYRSLTRLRYDLLHYKLNKKKIYSFELFRKKYLNLTECYKNKKELSSSKKYDVYIVGSDQIWRNEKSMNGIDNVFLLKFVNNKNSLKISYAASMGDIQQKLIPTLVKELENFDCISVRESELKDILESNIGKRIYHVIDPVFLIKRDLYEKYFIKSKPSSKKFIFVYSLENNINLNKSVNLINKGKNYEIYYYSRNIMKFDKKAKRIGYLSPQMFLEYIKYSEMVITNSFHATAYCLIFEKNFYSIPHTITGNRITSLLQLVGIHDNSLKNCMNNTIDWLNVNQKLDDYIKQSQHFLKEALLRNKS